MVQEVAPPLCDGRYHLVGELGVGGMATVYRAYDSRLQVERAIKLLAPHLASRNSIRRRFETEASTMAKLHHPNIVLVHDIGSEGNRCYIVMEMLTGGSLMERVDKLGVLPPKMAVEAIRAVVTALGAAHAQGVVHRDIKPHNVLVSSDGLPKVTDFGIAQVSQQDRSMTKTGAVMGTWAYMAPEQRISAKKADARADLYSSGASLYALLTGKEPFDLYTTELHEEMFAGIPDPVADLIKKACRYQPADRYQTSVEMVEAIEEILKDIEDDPADTKPLALERTDIAGPASGTLSPASFPDYRELSEQHAAAAGAGAATFDGSMLGDEDPPPPVLPGSHSHPGTNPPGGTMEPMPHTLTPAPTQPGTTTNRITLVMLVVLLAAAMGIFLVNFNATKTEGASEEVQAALRAAEEAAAAAASSEAARQEAADRTAELEAEREAERVSAEEAAAAAAEAARRQAEANAARRTTQTQQTTTTSTPDPTPDPTPAPTTASGEGTLKFNARPYANISINGITEGRTPFRMTDLAVGRHEVVLVTMDGREHSETVTIRRGQTTNRCWDFDLGTECER